MRIDIITCCPELLESPLDHSIIQRAKTKGLCEIYVHNLRDWTLDKHRKVDDYAFGFGAGMVLQVEPIDRLITHLKSEREYDEIIFTAPDGERFDQKAANSLSLKKGWNWVSTYLQVPSSLQATISAEQPWIEGDLIKNSATRQYSTYSEQMDLFVGELDKIHFSQMYMVYVNKANDLQIVGNELSQDSMQITLRGDGQWNELPCLYEQVISLREAMGDYYSYASPGDLIKSHHHFATYSADGRWVGDLTSLTPGEGYFFRRMGAGSVTVHFYKYRYSAPWKKEKYENEPMPTFSNPKASTNMTMIAKIEGLVDERVSGLEVFIDDDLVGKAKPLSFERKDGEELLYFLTIQSDAIGGTLRFETEDGQELTIVNKEQLDNQSSIVNRQIVNYVPNAHHGSLQAPVILTPIHSEEGRGEALPYKIIEDDHVVIIKNNEKYDVTGKKL